MSLELYFPPFRPWWTSFVDFPTSRGVIEASYGVLRMRSRLPEDSVGTTTVTLTNLVIGSAIQVETQAGAVVENRTADTTTEVFTLNLFAPSSAENDLRIKVRKGSAEPFYRPYETLTTLTAAAQSIFVSQISD